MPPLSAAQLALPARGDAESPPGAGRFGGGGGRHAGQGGRGNAERNSRRRLVGLPASLPRAQSAWEMRATSGWKTYNNNIIRGGRKEENIQRFTPYPQLPSVF